MINIFSFGEVYGFSLKTNRLEFNAKKFDELNSRHAINSVWFLFTYYIKMRSSLD